MMARSMLAVMWGLVLGGCAPQVPGDDDGSSDDGETSVETATTDEPPVGWFDVGWGDLAFHPLEDGGVLQVVWGGQGAAMFPLPLRGGDFVLPDPPDDYTSELAPILDMYIDIEGHNDGVGGHFSRLANYPITFAVLPDGSYEYIYVRVLLPDTLDPLTLEGLPGHLSMKLQPYGSGVLEIERDVVIAGAAAPR